tara:strand:+ start:50900 stop:51760 length:861 start_codon:yes stop_codon:yes gene_type:complete
MSVKNRVVLLVLACALTAGISTGAFAVPITSNTALPVSEGEIILREQLIFSRASDSLAGISRELTVTSSVSVIGYGLSPRLAVFGVVPVIDRELRVGSSSSAASGLADAKAFARYEVFRRDGPGRTLRLASFAGVTIPTGRTGETGDGSTDLFGGLVLTSAHTDWSFDGQLGFVLNGEADGFARGDSVSLDASVQYRISPRRIDVGTRGFLYGVLEANLTHADGNRTVNIVDPNSGGTTLWITPGVQYAARRWIAEAAVRIPAATHLNGTALEPDYALITSLRLNF